MTPSICTRSLLATSLLRVERAQRRLGGALLRLLLGLADAARVLAIADVRRDLEGLVVIRSLLLHHVVAHVQATARRALLQARLEVVQPRFARRRGARAEQPRDHGEGGVEAAVEIDGGDERLARVGQHRRFTSPARLLLAAAEKQ